MIILILLLLTPWTWYLFQKDFIITLLLIGLSSVLLKATLNYPKPSFINNTALVVLFLIIALLVLVKGFDKEIWITSPVEIAPQLKRHNFYAEAFGQLYRNRIGIYYYKNISPPLFKIQRNLFSNMDINLYFFASHPRERGGLIEFEKYPYIFLPIFLYGVSVVIKQRKFILGFYLIAAILISSFISSNYLLGPILFFPLMNVILIVGFISLLKFIRSKGSLNEI